MPAGKNNYRLTPRAERDLEEIWLYTYSNWPLEQADHYHDEIMSGISAITAAPGPGQRLEDVRPGYQRYRCGAHFIFYRHAKGGLIEIIRVLHEKMDFESHL